MRILIVNSKYYPNCNGGAEFCARSLAEHLLSMGNRVDVLTLDEKTHRETVNGISVLYLKSFVRKWGSKKGIRTLMANCLFVFDFINLLPYTVNMQGKYDIIHTHAIEDFSPSIWIAAKLCNIPVIYTMHDEYIKCPHLFMLHRNNTSCKKPRYLCKIRSKIYNWIIRTQRIQCVAPSHFIREESGIESVVIANGIKLVNVEKANNHSPFTFAFIGTLTKLKGIDLLIETFQRLPEQSCELIIAGDGELRDFVEKSAKKNQRIHYYGWVTGEKKDDFLNSANVLICPSYSENSPYVVLEAYDYCLPVIASQVGGLPEMVVDGETGLLFPVGNGKKLEFCMNRMKNEMDFYCKCSKNAKKKAKEYSLESMTEKYYGLYQTVIKKEMPIKNLKF